MKNHFLRIAWVFIIIGCGDGNVLIQIDPEKQASTDSVTIVRYMTAKGYTDFKTTESGVGYFILNQGIGESIDESDIVTFNYTGMLVNDSIFDTSIKKIADSIRKVENVPDRIIQQFPTNRNYAPFTYTYSQSGWTIPKSPPAQNGLIPGFVDGIAATFNQMKLGGKAVIAIPSALGYSTRGVGLLVPPNSVIIFELFPISVVKQ